MTAFYALAGVLVAATLVLLLRPLLRSTRTDADDGAELRSNVRILRDQLAELQAERDAGMLDAAQFEAARADLERRVLEDSATGIGAPGPRRATASAGAIAVAVAVPALAAAMYLALGNRQAFDPILRKPPAQATAEDIEVLVDRLAARMRAQPEDAQGWALLGRTYAAMQRFEPARDAYAEAVKRHEPDAQLLADYADALAMAQGQRLAGEPQQLIDRALQLDPANLKALALAGSAAMERGDTKTAIDFWSRARAVAPDGSEFAAGLDGSLRDAHAAAGQPAPAVVAAAASAPPAGVAATPAAAGAASVRVKVSLAPALAASVQPGDTLFVFARAADGPRMPLAIARRGAAELPLELTLDDSMAMSPQMRLSAFDRVVIGARISRSGNATPASGDLEGLSPPVAPGAPGAEPVSIVVDTKRP